MLFRPGTWDETIFNDVALRNEYRLPERFEPMDRVIDVGAHVGGFSHACLERGAGCVVAYEADLANFGLATHNLADRQDRCRVKFAAVWRSDNRGPKLLGHSGYGNSENTGGGNVLFIAGCTVPTEPLDAILMRAGAVRLLKLDCEGSEWPILLTAKNLRLAEEIIGEFHEIGGEYSEQAIPAAAQVDHYRAYTVDVLIGQLNRFGFEVEWKRSRDASGAECSLGHFWAKRMD